MSSPPPHRSVAFETHSLHPSRPRAITSTSIEQSPSARKRDVDAVNREAKLNALAAAGAFGVGDDGAPTPRRLPPLPAPRSPAPHTTPHTPAAHSWSFDGFRSLRFWDGKATVYGRRLGPGDVLGVYVDVDGQTVDFACNGQQARPFGRAFAGNTGGGGELWDLRSNDAKRIVHAFTGTGTFEVNFGDRPFTFAPAAGYQGVHASRMGVSAAGAGAGATAAVAAAAAAAGMFRPEAGPLVTPAAAAPPSAPLGLVVHSREALLPAVPQSFAQAFSPTVNTGHEGQRVRPLSFRRTPEPQSSRLNGF